MRSLLGPALVALLLAGCGDEPPEEDAGGVDGGALDAGGEGDAGGDDAGTSTDAGPVDDAGVGADAGDAGSGTDGGSAPPGDVCATAEPIGEVSLTGLSFAGYADDVPLGERCPPTAGPERFFSIVVPPSRQLVVTTRRESGSGWLPWVGLFEGCPTAPTPRCLGSAEVVGDTLRTVYANDGATDRTIVVMVDPGMVVTDTFALQTELRDPPLGDTCGEAIPTAAGTFTATLEGYSDTLRAGTDCVASDGPDTFYAVDVPAGELLTAVTSPMGAGGVSVSLLTDCATPYACLASDDTGATDSFDIVSWLNTGTSTVRVLVVVDSGYWAASDYGLTVTLGPPTMLRGEVCTSPESAGFGLRTGDSTVGYADDYPASGSGSCAFGDGPDRAYRISVLGGARLTATVTPDPGLDLTVSITTSTSACASPTPTCESGVDAAGAGGVETAFADNATTSRETYYVVVDGVGAGDAGRYSIELQQGTIPPP